MSDPTAGQQCNFCKIANPISYQFCPECGKRVSRACPYCGNRIRIEDKICWHCHSDLANAGLGITNQRAKVWRRNLRSMFPEYAQLWKPEGYGTSLTQLTKKVQYANVSDTHLSDQVIALLLGIADLDWCLRVVSFGNIVIKNGAFGAGTFSFDLVDLDKQQRYSIQYEMLDSIRRTRDEIELSMNNGGTIRLFLKTPRPAKIATVGLVIASLANNFGSKTWSDQELSRQAWGRKADNHRQKIEASEAFSNAIFNFFSEVIHATRVSNIAHPEWEYKQNNNSFSI